MEIVEMNEKSPRMKNKKLTFDFNKEELHILFDSINIEIKRTKEFIKNGCEMENVYWKDSFNRLSFYVEINKALSEALLKDSVFEISYECFDILWNFITEEKERLSKKICTYSRFLLPDKQEKYIAIDGILNRYWKEADKAINKLYPKRKNTFSKIHDYVYESAYNGFFLPCDETLTLHVPMREKDNILCCIDEICFLADSGVKSINVMVEGFTIEIPLEKAVKVCEFIGHMLTQDFYSGNIFQINMKDYVIFSYLCNMETSNIFH